MRSAGLGTSVDLVLRGKLGRVLFFVRGCDGRGGGLAAVCRGDLLLVCDGRSSASAKAHVDPCFQFKAQFILVSATGAVVSVPVML